MNLVVPHHGLLPTIISPLLKLWAQAVPKTGSANQAIVRVIGVSAYLIVNVQGKAAMHRTLARFTSKGLGVSCSKNSLCRSDKCQGGECGCKKKIATAQIAKSEKIQS